MQTTSESSDYKEIIFERRDSTVILYYNRPDKRNAVTYNMVQEFRRAYKQISQDREVRVVIMAAKGKSLLRGWRYFRIPDEHDRADGAVPERKP